MNTKVSVLDQENSLAFLKAQIMRFLSDLDKITEALIA